MVFLCVWLFVAAQSFRLRVDRLQSNAEQINAQTIRQAIYLGSKIDILEPSACFGPTKPGFYASQSGQHRSHWVIWNATVFACQQRNSQFFAKDTADLVDVIGNLHCISPSLRIPRLIAEVPSYVSRLQNALAHSRNILDPHEGTFEFSNRSK